ncbi:MAG: Coenzyme F420 hydrogenase/dehydrogenase, beta subunit C-terminal domain [Alphaproteobacteria bacterium]|nr:Coenzyme F420 hydrogenase/dehydrogenase, beta subunit C-terminal domain [Alphaproteobacteria bacterium]
MTRKIKSIDDILKNRLCTGCGACAAFAPAAIEMAETADENWRPRKIGALDADVEESIAKACTGAFPASAGEAKDLHESSWGPVLDVWEGYAGAYDIRHKGSSGGAVTALALFAIEKMGFHGALHVKARKDNPTLNEAAISKCRAELMEGAGSRYAPASIGDKLRLVADADKPSVVIGKPCDIAGANMVAGHVPELAARMGLTISIFCAGVPSHKGTEELLEHLAPDQPGVLASLDYRGEGWPGDMRATWRTLDGPQRVAISYNDGWGNVLQKHRQWRCQVCADHTGEHADISVGDPWQTPPEKDAVGKSLIVVRTERGRAFLKAIADSGYLFLEKKDPAILFDAQPNLFTTKGAVWGRSVALKVAGLNAPATADDSFACWKKLPVKAKVQSVAGTFKRVRSRKLHEPKEILWAEEQRG